MKQKIRFNLDVLVIALLVCAVLIAGQLAPTANAAPLAGEVLISTPSNLETGENGQQVEFDVWLSEQPDSSVLVPFSSTDPNEGVPDLSMLTFSPMNWNIPQKVIVTGVDDDVIDGNQVYSLVVGVVFSIDPDFNNVDPADIDILNLDNDYAGIVTDTQGPLVLREGEEVSFALRLASRPSAVVSVNLSSSDPESGTLSVDHLSIDPADWNVPVPVTILGVEDILYNATKDFEIDISPLVSSDPMYNGFDPTDILVSKLDNEYRLFSTMNFNNFAITTQMVFEDYFEGDRGWEIIAEALYSSEYVAGALHLRHELGNYNVRAIAPASADEMPAGYRVSVDARLALGAHPATKLGILFDWQAVSRFYRFIVDAGSNQYFVQKFSTTYQTIASGELPPGTDYFASHNLTTERDGAAIRVYFDGVLLVELNDVTYTGGRAGIIVIAPVSMPGGISAEGEFDNFTVQHTGYSFQNLFASAAALEGWELVSTGNNTIDAVGGVLAVQQLDQAESVRAIAPLPVFRFPDRYVIETKIVLMVGSNVDTKVGILFDWVDPSSHYRYIILPGTLQYAIQKLDGSYQSLVIGSLPAGFDPGIPHKLRLERDGSLIRAYLDGRVLTVYAKTDELTGKCGLTVIAPSSLESGEFAGAEFDFIEVRGLY